MKKKSANQRLKDWVLAGKSITPLQALNKFGILRHSARILDMRNEGVDITTTIVKRNGKQFAKYQLA